MDIDSIITPVSLLVGYLVYKCFLFSVPHGPVWFRGVCLLFGLPDSELFNKPCVILILFGISSSSLDITITHKVTVGCVACHTVYSTHSI